ncbi:MAG: YitT family protein [Clostridia bacterium]|nr:YitT family protein [Clostridia bacterium]
MEEEKVVNTEESTALPPKITKENIDPLAGTKRSIVYSWIRSVLLMLLSSLLIAFASYSLITPNDFTIGGAAGISILINVASNGKVPQSIMSFCINFPLVIIAFFFVKRRFAILSVFSIATQSVFLLIIEKLLPTLKLIFPGGETSKMFAAVAAGLCIGVAIALAFKAGGSTGGADIVAVIIQKKFKATSIAWMLFIINCIVIGASIFIFEPPVEKSSALYYGALLMPIIMAIFESFVESKINEAITNGLHSAREFRIITDKPEEMAQALMKELSRGVTALPATGMYTKITHTMLLCVVSRRQVPTLKKIVKSVDPNSFAVMSNASQVLGLGFHNSDLQ